MLELKDHMDIRVSNLSGGTKRKVSLAISLITIPRILILDEAFNCIDPIVRQRIYKYLKSLKNTSVLMITQRVDEAEKNCDTIAIMADGSIKAIDEPSILKHQNPSIIYLLLEPADFSSEGIQSVHQIVGKRIPFFNQVRSDLMNEDGEESKYG